MALLPRYLFFFALQVFLVYGDILIATVPNLVRAGDTETVLVTIQKDNIGVARSVPVTVSFKNADHSLIAEETINIQEGGYDRVNSETAYVYVNPEEIPDLEAEEGDARYITVTVTCNLLGFSQDKRVLLSLDSGYVFIQTDKPIYTPTKTVKTRIISLNQRLSPLQQQLQLNIRTPQNVVVERKDIAPEAVGHGVFTHMFWLPEEPMVGYWSIVVYYGREMKSNRTVQFEVKEYVSADGLTVLPTFFVEIHPPNYILQTTRFLDITVNGRYVYHKPVEGRSVLKIGLIDPDGEIEIKETDVQQLLEGGARHHRDINILGDDWFDENVGCSLYLETTVYDEATGHFENASDTSVKIVNSPYIFSRERTLQYFKKGLPFQVKAELTYTNGRPAPLVPVRVVATGKLSDDTLVTLRDEHHNINDEEREITDNTDRKGEVIFNLYVPIGCEEITVNLVTFDQNLIVVGAEEMNNNANLSFVLKPYESPANGNEYLVIRTQDQVFRYGDTFNLDLFLERQRIEIFIHVFVIARGKIIHYGSRQVGNIDGYQITVTPEMIPSARIVAYFIGENNHIIADSVRIEVRVECHNDVTVGVVDTDRRPFGDAAEPNNPVQFRITAKPGTNVSLIAVDKAVLLLRDFHGLTRKKMFSTMDTQDTGCGPGGGMTSEHIFKNAGVTVMASDGPLNVGDREGTHCVTVANSRRRRSLEELLEELGNDDRNIFACLRGHRRIGSGSCNEKSVRFQRRARTRFPEMTEDVGDELIRIFIACCKKAERDESCEQNIDIDLAGFGSIADTDPFNDTSVRFDIPDSWAFDVVHVDSNAPVYRPYTLPGSMTTWSIQAFGLHENFPMCVIEPTELVVRSDLGIQLLLPYSVKRNEHVEIQAVVFNYGRDDVEVEMSLKTPPEICSEGTPNVLSVKSGDNFTVTYVVIGGEVGKWPITVVIVSTKGRDGVRKKLNVIAEGIERTFHHSVQLNPQGVELNRRRRDLRETENCIWDAENAAQLSCFDIALPPTALPGTESCHISITGSPLGPAMTAVVTGLGHWIRQPTGCGEQIMIRLAPNVYVLKYLLATNSGNDQIEATALSNINSGIVRETKYRNANGSFSAFLGRPGSTWLTAFVAKVFCQASELTEVDAMVPCSAISWIGNNRQRPNGAFYEGLAVIHKEMTGGINGDIAMTAFTLITMAECWSTCDQVNPALLAAKNRAISYLESQLDELQRPYVIAVVTYALALVNSYRRADANIMLNAHAAHDPVTSSRAWGVDIQQQDGRPFWFQRRPSALSVEMTGYALLAQIELRELTYAGEIANWLSTQQNYGGGFVSTQDTVIALQSLSEFSALSVGGDLNLHCNISSESGFETIFRLQNEDFLLQETVEVSKEHIRDRLLVKTQGVGIGTLNVEVKYYEDSNDRRELCPFDIVISTKIINRNQPRNEEIQYLVNETLLINITVTYFGDTSTSMGIIDFGLLTGFIPDKKSCDKVVEENRFVARYEESDRSVIFYTDYFPTYRGGSISFAFKAKCVFNVTNIHHAAVRVYDYYDPDEECIQFYTGEGSNVEQTLCNDDQCTCISSECPPCFDTPDTDDLLVAACVSAQTYVYHLQVTNIREEDGYKVVTATILDPIKRGYERNVHMHDSREFRLSSVCRCPEIKIRQYLLIGSNTMKFTEPDGNGAVSWLRYVIDNNSIMTRWRSKFNKEVRIPIRDGYSGCN